jgi:hypothetical protein
MCQADPAESLHARPAALHPKNPPPTIGSVRQCWSILFFFLVGPLLVLTNRHIYKEVGFKYPATVSSLGVICTAIFVHVGVAVEIFKLKRSVATSFWATKLLPVGACQAATLATGNAAYVFLGVSFIQMLKAGTPVIIMGILYATGVQRLSRAVFLCVCAMALGSMATVVGVSTAAFSFLGIALLFVSEVVEAGRCVLTQFVLKDCKFSVVESQYYMAPASLCALSLYGAYYEWGQIMTSGDYLKLLAHPQWFVASGLLGIAVNFASFLVIQTTSALFVKMLVTARNAGLVLLSVFMFDEMVTAVQLSGYAVTLAAFACYNYHMATAKPAAMQKPSKLSAVTTPRAEDFASNVPSLCSLRGPESANAHAHEVGRSGAAAAAVHRVLK